MANVSIQEMGPKPWVSLILMKDNKYTGCGTYPLYTVLDFQEGKTTTWVSTYNKYAQLKFPCVHWKVFISSSKPCAQMVMPRAPMHMSDSAPPPCQRGLKTHFHTTKDQTKANLNTSIKVQHTVLQNTGVSQRGQQNVAMAPTHCIACHLLLDSQLVASRPNSQSQKYPMKMHDSEYT